MTEFVHLHLHTEFSLLDGACRINDLMQQAAAQKVPALAVTEHGNMFSAVAFHDAARKHGVKPILGCEVYVAPGDRRSRTGTPGETANHLVLLAETMQGFHNLIKLVSAGYTEGFYYKPRIDKDLLAQHAEGLIGLSSCLKGEVATALRTEQPRKALDAAAAYRDILGARNFFLEMQYQGIDEQLVVNRGLPSIAGELGLALVCTNDVHYLRCDDQKPHDVLLCIGTGKMVQDVQRLKYHGDQFYLKTPEEMARVFGEYPEALANTVRIAERCDVTLESGTYHLPNFEVPAGFDLDGYFEHVVREGFTARLPRLRELAGMGVLKHPLSDYDARLDYEIRMIKQMGYPGYFLIVWDFIRYAREQTIPVGPGRGSAAGSLVAWCLRITDVDPLEFDLIFERFLNPERVSLPDIDIDFCERRRGEVIEYVTRKYGRENVAQIITFGTMKARAAVRDVGRVLNMPYGEVDRVAKLIPATLDMKLEKALAETPALRELETADPAVKELLAVAQRLEGMARHPSVHAAGVVIAPKAITEFAPLYKSPKDEITTQWPMKEVERVGLLKMDFLGLSTLTLIDDCLKEIARTTGETIDIDTVPLDDQKTLQLFADAQTLGVFQFESGGMRDQLRRARPQRFDDLIALNALYRPGPLKGGVVDDFIERRHGKKQIEYEVPQLEPILRDTYGVIAYQEQVMRIARDLGGFTMGEADVLRKAMGKKDPAVMQAQRERFVSGAVAQGIPGKKATKIFDFMEFFAGYGFNKSHSTTYAYVAYQTGWLKAHYPRHFMAALLTIESGNTEKLAMYLGECRDLGVPVLAPDINRSALAFTVEEAGVRYGLGAVRNVGEGAVQALLEARGQMGRVDSLFTLCEALDLRTVNKRVLESLVKAGTFDALSHGTPGWETLPVGTRRARLMATLDRAIEQGARTQRDRAKGQSALFGGDDEPGMVVRLAEAEPWPEAQQLAFEKEALGLYLSGHPLSRFADDLRAFGARTTADLTESMPDMSLGGIIGALRLSTTRKGDPMASFALEDELGAVDVVVYPETFRQSRQVIAADAMVVVRGKFERDDESARIVAGEVLALSTVRERLSREVAIRLAAPPHGRQTFEALAEVLTRHRGDRRVRVELEVAHDAERWRLVAEVPQVRVRPSERLVADVEQVCGRGSVTLR
ncbi:MAG: DNA polymerase III subunit alpha [Vicinamibacteraceae bacterium]|nr:DNA polymerase III subunit alpha [Vicinamibacteraceae bacterium]